MDLSLQVDGTTLYIRTAVMLKSASGYIFEKSKKGYAYLVGGKLKINELSIDGVKREVYEEVGLNTDNFTLLKVIENIYTNDGESVHEICFLYMCEDIFDGVLPEQEFVNIAEDDISSSDIRPEIIKNILINYSK